MPTRNTGASAQPWYYWVRDDGSNSDLVVRPLTVAIPFQVSLLLPQLAAPHPAREALMAALERTAKHLVEQTGLR